MNIKENSSFELDREKRKTIIAQASCEIARRHKEAGDRVGIQIELIEEGKTFDPLQPNLKVSKGSFGFVIHTRNLDEVNAFWNMDKQLEEQGGSVKT